MYLCTKARNAARDLGENTCIPPYRLRKLTNFWAGTSRIPQILRNVDFSSSRTRTEGYSRAMQMPISTYLDLFDKLTSWRRQIEIKGNKQEGVCGKDNC